MSSLTPIYLFDRQALCKLYLRLNANLDNAIGFDNFSNAFLSNESQRNDMVRVTAAIIIDHGKVLIAKRKRTGRLGGMWEFPGGKIEPGESPEQCLKRELKEEFEIEAAVGEYLGTSVYAYDFGTIELLAFQTQVTGSEMKLNFHTAIAWVAVGDLCKYDFAPADRPFVVMLSKGQTTV
jgi:8-oxo-dGTP diphosphatase